MSRGDCLFVESNGNVLGKSLEEVSQMSKQVVADVGGIPEYNSEVQQSRSRSRPAGYGGVEFAPGGTW